MKKKENRTTLLLLIGTLSFLLISYIVYVIINNNGLGKNVTNEKGNIELKEQEEFSVIVDEEWLEADNEYKAEKPYATVIIDDEDKLSSSGFMSMKGHFMKNEAIGLYLESQGCYSETVTVISDSVKRDGNNSYFSLIIDDYPEMILKVTFYGITEEFDFTITGKEQ